MEYSGRFRDTATRSSESALLMWLRKKRTYELLWQCWMSEGRSSCKAKVRRKDCMQRFCRPTLCASLRDRLRRASTGSKGVFCLVISERGIKSGILLDKLVAVSSAACSAVRPPFRLPPWARRAVKKTLSNLSCRHRCVSPCSTHWHARLEGAVFPFQRARNAHSS